MFIITKLFCPNVLRNMYLHRHLRIAWAPHHLPVWLPPQVLCRLLPQVKQSGCQKGKATSSPLRTSWGYSQLGLESPSSLAPAATPYYEPPQNPDDGPKKDTKDNGQVGEVEPHEVDEAAEVGEKHESPQNGSDAKPGTKSDSLVDSVGDSSRGDLDFDVPAPNYLSEAAAKARMRRICTPDCKGNFKVPQQVIDQFNDPTARVNLMKMFERVGHDRDRVLFSQIHPFSLIPIRLKPHRRLKSCLQQLVQLSYV